MFPKAVGIRNPPPRGAPLACLYVPRLTVKRAELSACAVRTVNDDFFVSSGVRVTHEESLPTGRVLVTRSFAALDAFEGALHLPHEPALPIASSV